MEIRAYPAEYLNNAMVTMATMLDYAVNARHEHIDYYFQSFLLSPYAQQFERGNPAFITGNTGVELYRLVRMDFSYPQPVYVSIDRTPEFWVGKCLAYYHMAPNAFQNNWNQYWNNVLNQQHMEEAQRQQKQKELQRIAKEAISQAIKASGNKPAELAYNAACLFTSDNLMEATENAAKVLQNMGEMKNA